MRTYVLVFFVSLFFIPVQKLHAQGDFALLEKNVNIRARGVSHQLNATKDTLLLTSDTVIDRVYSVNMQYKREIETYINKNSYKVPLTGLTKGKHVFVVSHSGMKIVFVIRVLKGRSIILTPISEEKLTARNTVD